MSRHWPTIALLGVALATPLTSAAAAVPEPTLPSVPNTRLVPPSRAHGPYLPVPPDAVLDGEVKPSETGYDARIFRSRRSYAETVRFYDRTLRAQHDQVLARVVAPDAVTYRVRRPDARVDSVKVRRTRPATLIETREAW